MSYPIFVGDNAKVLPVAARHLNKNGTTGARIQIASPTQSCVMLVLNSESYCLCAQSPLGLSRVMYQLGAF